MKLSFPGVEPVPYELVARCAHCKKFDMLYFNKNSKFKKQFRQSIPPLEKLLEGKLSVKIQVVCPVTTDIGYKPDWDNLAKTLCDALTGLIWKDDCQITCGSLEKVNGEEWAVHYDINEICEGDLYE